MSKKQGKKANKKGKEINVSVWVAIITGLVTIIVALFNFPPFTRMFDPPSTPVVLSTAESTPTFGIVISTFETPIINPGTTPSLTEVPISTNTATPTFALPIGMHISLTTNQTSGNRPLEVRFDARGSYFIAADGTQFNCGACDYFWQVRKDGVTIFGPRQENGVFLYTFGDRGTYYVSVYVCRSDSTTECNGSGTPITVN